MGDPCLSLWTDTPSAFNVDYNNSINMGSDLLEFYVTDDQGNDVDDARIVLYVDDDNVYETLSNESGYANIQLNELTLSNAKASIGTDISYLFSGSKLNVMPYITFEYGLDYSETSSQSMYYTVEGPTRNYILDLYDGMKTHNWQVDIGLMLETFSAMNTTIGCRFQGRSSYFSDYSSISNNDISSSEICFLELMWNF